VILSGLLLAAIVPAFALPVLRSTSAIHSLNNLAARFGYPVDFTGTVTYSDPEWGLLFVHDASGSIYINVHGSTTVYPLGTTVHVIGVTGSGDINPIVSKAKIIPLGLGPAPDAEPKSVDELDAGVADSSWIMTEGILHPCDLTWNRVCYRILEGKKVVWLISPHPVTPVAQQLLGARVQVRGVSGIHLDANNRREAAQIFVSDLSGFRVLLPSPAVDFHAPVRSIASLQTEAREQKDSPRSHIQGVVIWENASSLAVQDKTGSLFVNLIRPSTVQVGNLVDVLGFAGQGVYGLTVLDAMVQVASAQSGPLVSKAQSETVSDILRLQLNLRRVTVQAHLNQLTTASTEYIYDMEDNGKHFSAILPRNETVKEIVRIAPDSHLQLTGITVLQSRSTARPDSFLLLVNSPADIVVLSEYGWLTWRRALVIAGMLFLGVAIPSIWVFVLRKTVRKQTAIIRTQLENELLLASKYQRLFERNLAAVFTWQSDGKVIDCNSSFARMLGYEHVSQLIGLSYLDFIKDAEQKNQLATLADHDAITNLESVLYCQTERTLHVLQNITPVRTSDGVVFETTAIDVSSLKHHQYELQKARDAAIHESLQDPLTLLPNRKYMTTILPMNLEEARILNQKMAFLYIDLDGFKQVNDNLGHSAGDELLFQLAHRLRGVVRADDIVLRLGGDEFMVVLCNIPGDKEAIRVAKILRDAVCKPVYVKENVLASSASIGISIFPDDAKQLDSLIHYADCAMYEAKREGKNRAMRFSSEMKSDPQ
jgi:diguanylate cyclase (GGDEF)-like protein/PAS domain S-box-containing protein